MRRRQRLQQHDARLCSWRRVASIRVLHAVSLTPSLPQLLLPLPHLAHGHERHIGAEGRALARPAQVTATATAIGRRVTLQLHATVGVIADIGAEVMRPLARDGDGDGEGGRGREDGGWVRGESGMRWDGGDAGGSEMGGGCLASGRALSALTLTADATQLQHQGAAGGEAGEGGSEVEDTQARLDRTRVEGTRE